MATPGDVARVLLDRATEDELMARSLLPIEGVTDTGIGFHAQQPVEKSLKAVLAQDGVDFPYTHDLTGLLRLCQDNTIQVPPELAGVDDLTVFGARLRYDASPTARLDRDQALAWAAAAVAWARGIVEAPAQPRPPART